MNSQEEKWFERPTWNHEKTTFVYIEIIIVNNRKMTKTIYRILMDYLKELGFKLKEDYHNQISNVLVLDLVEKEIMLISKIRTFKNFKEPDLAINSSIFRAYPSQLKPYMESHKGMLTGKKFGL